MECNRPRCCRYGVPGADLAKIQDICKRLCSDLGGDVRATRHSIQEGDARLICRDFAQVFTVDRDDQSF